MSHCASRLALGLRRAGRGQSMTASSRGICRPQRYARELWEYSHVSRRLGARRAVEDEIFSATAWCEPPMGSTVDFDGALR